MLRFCLRRFLRWDMEIVTLLLWLVRSTRSRLVWANGSIVYRWVKSPDGGFDHWFETPDGARAIGFYLIRLGLWRLACIILTHADSTGLSCREYQEDQFGRSEGYYCTEPLFEVRSACAKREPLSSSVHTTGD